MKFILPLLLVLAGCTCTSHPFSTVHVEKHVAKTGQVFCTKTLDNCSNVVDMLCPNHAIPMLAEGPDEHGVFTVTFDCLDK